ncbi:hypothetical protein MYX78_12790, partial [Acidobacteria bacterium AH-259-G07]|nr:hypothetical protein [Acidobacteria bacterium AH-259-G07]
MKLPSNQRGKDPLPRSSSRDEGGFALLMAVIVTAFLLLFGLSIAFSSMTEFSMSNELEKKKMAFMTADAGYNTFKDALRGMDISTILQSTTQVPQYINYSEPTSGTHAFTYFSRNPLATLEAMNVDFDNPPSPIGNRTVYGLLTPASGQMLPGGGRYWAKISDNDDGDGVDDDGDGDDQHEDDAADSTVDMDGIVYLRVMGIQSIGAGQISTYGGTVKNSVAILEAKLERDMTLDFSAPFSVYGPLVSPSKGKNLFAGNSFQLDGYDHPGATLWHLKNNKIDTGG